MSEFTLLDRLRQPEYTGENRCRPCTVVNLGIIAVAGVAVAVWSALAAAVVVAVGLVALALRGYVVPGTPRFAPRLVEPLPFDFGHTDPLRETDTLSDAGDDAAEADPQAVLESLVVAGVVQDDGEQLFLNDAFREAWIDRMATLRSADESAFLDRIEAASPADIEAQLHNDHVLLAGGRDVWLRPSVAIAETAAVETLAEWDLPAETRPLAAQPLRTFLRTCPVCGGPVSETTCRDCCGGSGSVHESPDQPVLACEDCGAAVAEL
ncbi:Membrane associated protein with Zn zinger domain [Halapricum desulfuricans]|uniref:Membrane associated protein with Zn zinger domain n=1 Tax=Halapricum desulfuricans TaxID=2841257 RepID=A0A897NEW8_9EURY|nr:hypothetical protein [Halapricum desulfuricans]QSG11068.1 Membrane associated protein with Zn zinger domain [Halapricum desulfuricans]